METRILKITPETSEKERNMLLDEAGEVIKKGGLVAFPTETVYGLGGDGLNPESSKKIYAAKGRPSDNPLIIHIAEFDAVAKIVKEIPPNARLLADAFWPGPLTMILNKSDIVPTETTGGLPSVAIRMPSHELAREFIKRAGGYIAAPSANLSGRPSPTKACHVIQDLDKRIDMIIAADGEAIGLESTIVDLTGDMPMILRPGFITAEMLETAVGKVDTDVTITNEISGVGIQNSPASDIKPKAPGMKYRHYAPKGELTIVEGRDESVIEYINECCRRHRSNNQKTGVIGISEYMDRYEADSIKDAGANGDSGEMAKRLYSILREFDDENTEYMYAHISRETIDSRMGQAVMNRLLKAAGHKTVTVH